MKLGVSWRWIDRAVGFLDQLRTILLPDGQNQIEIQITADPIHQQLMGLDVPENGGVNSPP